jgi:hypothetical protein
VYKQLVFTREFLTLLQKLKGADHNNMLDALDILDRDPESPALNAHEVESRASDENWEGCRFMAAHARGDPSLRIVYVIKTQSATRVVMLTCYRPEG